MSVLTVMAQRYPRQGFWTYDPYYDGECNLYADTF